MASDYPLGFYFSLSLKGEDAAFKEVSGISKEMKLDEIVSGGENRFKYRLPSGTSYQNLVLKRAMIPKNSALSQWCADTLNLGFAKPLKTMNVKVILYNAKHEICSSWSFINAYPVKWSCSDLKSQENELLIESIELAYHYFEDGGD